MDNKVRILLTGLPPKEDFFHEGESISQLAARLTTEAFPIGKVKQFYVNGSPVSDASRTMLRPGDSLSGAPKVDGGR